MADVRVKMMAKAAAKLDTAKQQLLDAEADLLAELAKQMANCGLEDATAVCLGWQPKLAALPPQFADDDGTKPIIAFKAADAGEFGWVKMVAQLLMPGIDSDSLADKRIAVLNQRVQKLDAVGRWQRADANYDRAEQALADAKAAFT